LIIIYIIESHFSEEFIVDTPEAASMLLDNPKMYIIVREDLAFKYIQGSHALARYAIENTKRFFEWNNRTIIFLGVWNYPAMLEFYKSVKDKGFTTFREPDLDNQITALAYYGCDNEQLLRSLPLASR
jgi:hypothetical protein